MRAVIPPGHEWPNHGYRQWCQCRRRLLASGCGLVTLAGLAGCTTTEDTPTNNDSDADADSDTAIVNDVDAEDLGLREANVVDVTFERENGSYTFDVALHHDDDGEDGYANWWQVEALDGTRLGRRELLHAHSQQPFTRSETIEVPDEATCVVVRGHDQTHEYGGLAAVVDLTSAKIQLIDQGPEKQRFEAEQCP